MYSWERESKRPKKERTKLAPLSANSFSLIFFAFVHFSCRHRNTVTYVNVRREKNGRKEGRPAAASESNRIRKFRALDRLSGGDIYIYGASVYTQTGWRSQGDDQTSSALSPSIGGGFHPAKLRRRPLMRARQEGKRESSDAGGKERSFEENKSQNLH